ncbi:homeobox protein 9 [Fopius arisanus]|uniref:Homeobox protein 9 n=1 Tax=Fopius arisanus TaxID=64838 RepID=A0A9R1TNX9_9HYME|nr:PREDICTED: homeobox protein 9-like [Fopius arisanus]
MSTPNSSKDFLQNIERLRGRDNYSTWKFAMKMYLEMEDLWGCIQGTESYIADERKMTRARTKIALSLDPVNYVHVEEATTPKQAWENLQSTFDDAGLARKVGLLRELTTASLEKSSSVEDYVNKVINTAHKLRGVGFTVQEDWLGTLLLAGLPEDYKPMIMAIENSGIRISADSIKTRFLQDVKDPKSNNKSDESALYSRGHNTRRKFGPRCYNCDKVGHLTNNCRYGKHENNRSHKNHRNENRNQNNYNNNNPNNNINNKKVMFALCAAKNLSNVDWIIDSGASTHISPERNFFQNFKRKDLAVIVTADESILHAEGVGDIEIPVSTNGNVVHLLVKDVLYVPKAATNLLSINNTSNQLIAIAKESCGIYKLEVDRKLIYHISQSDDKTLWHRRLGHMNSSYMKLLKDVLATGVKYVESSKFETFEESITVDTR